MNREQVLEDALNHLLNAVSAHAAPDLLAFAVSEAEHAIQTLRGSTPEAVVEAVRALNEDHFDLSAVAWETGTTALAVFSWDSTAVVRYVMSDDLTTVISTDRVRNPKKGKGKYK